MWRFKSCPRCRGDLYVDRDLHGYFQECIQCGHLMDIDISSPAAEPGKIRQKKEKLPVAA